MTSKRVLSHPERSEGSVLIALLALALLAACNEGGGVKPSTVVSASDSADQVLYGFVHFLTRDGVREGRVEADTAYFYDPTQTTILRNMKLSFIDSAGNENATITSKIGTYKWQTGDMIADSNVVLKWGITDDRQLYDWHRQAGRGEVARKNGSIVLMDYQHGETSRFNFQNGWPSKVSVVFGIRGVAPPRHSNSSMGSQARLRAER